MSRVVITEEMNPAYCASVGCFCPIGSHQKSIKQGFCSEPLEVPDGCLCMKLPGVA